MEPWAVYKHESVHELSSNNQRKYREKWPVQQNKLHTEKMAPLWFTLYELLFAERLEAIASAIFWAGFIHAKRQGYIDVHILI